MEKTLAYFFVVSHTQNNRKHFIRVQKVFLQYLCKSEDHSPETKEIDRENVQRKSIFTVKKTKCPLFSHSTEQDRAEGTNYSGPHGFPTVIV